MQRYFILNPAAGQGEAKRFADRENAYLTRGVRDACDYTETLLRQQTEQTELVVCGGDGTVSEVAEGVLRSGRSDVTLSIVPVGTGNDLLRSVQETGKDAVCADAMRINDRISMNAVNTGFDLNVVKRASEYKKKKLIAGSAAYLLGVLATLFTDYGTRLRADYVDEQGNAGSFEGDCLLAVVGNGAYYGGGFKASPAADLTDGLLELMIVKKVSRLKFLSLVGKYKKGRHIDPVLRRPIPQFEKIMLYRRVKSVVFSGIRDICYDGEIMETEQARVSVAARAVNVKEYI